MADLPKMPGPVELANLMLKREIQILDIRPSKVAAGGMLPNSVSMPYSNWRGSRDNQNVPINVGRLAEVIGVAGLRLDAPTYIVHHEGTDMDTGRAAYVYWLLKSAGAEHIGILHGGYSEWRDIGLPVASKPIQNAPYMPNISLSRAWRADDVLLYGIATQQVSGALMDIRSEEAVSQDDGRETALRATLPGAKIAPLGGLMASLRDAADYASIIDHVKSHVGGDRNGPVISFGESGELAALNWFYASELAGLPGFKLYPESVRGWNDSTVHILSDNKTN